MKKLKHFQKNSKSLREKAERKLQKINFEINEKDSLNKLETIHELRVHQIELEMQNDELLKAQNELEQSRSKYYDLFDFAPIGYFILDKKGNISEVNLTGASMLGLERNILMAKPLALFINNKDKDNFYMNRQAVLKTAIHRRFDVKMLCKNKEDFYAELLVYPVANADGIISHTRIAVIDISQRKQAEEKLLVYQEQLRILSSRLTLSEERIRRQIATQVHENIAQNLAIAKLRLDSLALSCSEEGEFLHAKLLIKNALENIRSLIFELSVPVLYEFGFIPAVKHLVENMKTKYNLTINLYDDGTSKPLSRDIQILLFRAVRELIINTIRHAEANFLSIKLMRDNKNIKIEVCDDGKGFNLHKTNITDRHSDGFGLFSVRETLGYAGGNLVIHSTIGKGTTAILEAPLEIKTTMSA